VKDTRLASLPLHDFAQNQIWCAIVALACELTAWMQTLTLAEHHARSWEPKRLRLRLFSISARHARTGRRRQLADLGSTATIMAVAFVACHRSLRGHPCPRPTRSVGGAHGDVRV
jgi:hypothetical protein